MYYNACCLIERLLLGIYEEYRLFCIRSNKGFEPKLSILKLESTTKGGFYKEKSFYPSQRFFPSPHSTKELYYKQENHYNNNKPFYYNHTNRPFYPELESNEINEEAIIRLIEARNKARKELNFKEADHIRNYLKSKGIALMDEKGARGKGREVTTWKSMKGPNDIENKGFVKAFG